MIVNIDFTNVLEFNIKSLINLDHIYTTEYMYGTSNENRTDKRHKK
jgi:hypothetical protein